MHEAKEKLIRERGTHLDSLMERMKEPRVRVIVERVMTGDELREDVLDDDLSYVLDLGLLVSERGVQTSSLQGSGASPQFKAR